MGTLYIVATPIGNLQDITFRAVDILQTVPYIASEDTRRTGLLLQHLRELTGKESRPKLISYYDQNELQRIPELLSLLLSGSDVALVSDAGTPAISDPGFKLIRTCRQESIPVVSIPGASSVLVALTSSGLPTDRFMFFGYFPKKSGHRRKLMEEIQTSLTTFQQTVIFFEAPHRLVQTLVELQEVFGNIPIVLARELTKIHEEIRNESVADAIKHFQESTPRGEFVILFNTKS